MYCYFCGHKVTRGHSCLMRHAFMSLKILPLCHVTTFLSILRLEKVPYHCSTSVNIIYILDYFSDLVNNISICFDSEIENVRNLVVFNELFSFCFFTY